MFLGADQGQGARLLDQLGDALHAPFGFAAADEIAQAADDFAGAQRLFAGLVQGVAQAVPRGVGLRLDQAARALDVVGDGRQRLVELVRQGRGHFAHRRQPRDVHQLGLQFLQARLGLLALGEIANEAGEVAAVA